MEGDLVFWLAYTSPEIVLFSSDIPDGVSRPMRLQHAVCITALSWILLNVEIGDHIFIDLHFGIMLIKLVFSCSGVLNYESWLLYQATECDCIGQGLQSSVRWGYHD